MIATRRASLATLAVAVIVAAGWHSISALREVALAEQVWAAVDASDWEAAVSLTDPLAASGATASPAVQRAFEARCWALLGLGRREDCADGLIALLAQPESDGWMPEPLLSGIAIGTLRDRGQLERAAALARRATAVHGSVPSLLQLELMTRGVVEGEDAVITELRARLELEPEDFALRAVLALVQRRRGDHEAALEVLGTRVPRLLDAVTARWFDEKAAALGALGRIDGVRETFRAWQALGESPAMIDARYALRLSVAQLPDPDSSWNELLRLALTTFEEQGGGDPVLHRQLYERWIAHLLAEDRTGDALAAFDRAASRSVVLEAISRSQIARGARGELNESGAPPASGLVMELSPGAPAGDYQIALSPDPEGMAPPDADFELHRLRAGVPLRVERAPGEWPLRWVLFDAERRVRGSGHAWPGQREPVVVELRAPLPPTPALARERLAADGHRRVMALVLDCFDWRLLQYLRTRGELPIFDALLASGHRAVLESDPPLTAAAMESLVWPDRGVRPSFVGQLHRLGVELAGLASVGDNPFAFLSLVLPEGESLFETVGAGDRVAANMLFTHGMIDAGRHAEVVGPHGRRRTARAARAYRPVRPDEQARFPLLLSRPRARAHIEGIAAEFDAATRVAAEAEVDLLMLRIEPLDILTHALYGELSEGGQDDGASLLLEAYRYVDHRLAELDASLDADDVLVVMSDHGIRTPMQHADDAIFVAAGGGIEAGRAAGRPHLRGVSRALASLLGLATDWPDTGVASGVASWSPRPLHLAVSRAKGASAPH